MLQVSPQTTEADPYKRIQNELSSLNLGKAIELNILGSLWLDELHKRLGHSQKEREQSFNFVSLLLRKLSSPLKVQILSLLKFSFEKLKPHVQMRKVQRILIEGQIFPTLTEMIGRAESEKEVALSIQLVSLLLLGPNLTSQNNFLRCLKKKPGQFVISISKILRSKDIERKERVTRIKDTLVMVQRMCQNCFRPMTTLLLEIGEGKRSFNNLLYQVGYFFIRVSLKEGHLASHTFLSEVLETLINLNYGALAQVKKYYAKWTTFTNHLQKVIFLSYKTLRQSPDPTIERTFVAACELLLSISQRTSKVNPESDNSLLKILDCLKLRALLTDVYFDSLSSSSNSASLKGGFILFILLVSYKSSALGSAKLKYFGISLPPDTAFLMYLTQRNQQIPQKELSAIYSQQVLKQSSKWDVSSKKLELEQSALLINSAETGKAKNSKFNQLDHLLAKRQGTLCLTSSKYQQSKKQKYTSSIYKPQKTRKICCKQYRVFKFRRPIYYVDYIHSNNDRKLSTQRELFLAAFLFFSSKTGSLEIKFRGILQRVIFRIPEYCWFLTKTTRNALIKQSGLLSQSEKNELLLSKLSELRVDMLHQQKLLTKYKVRPQQHQCVHFFSNRYKVWNAINFFLILIINLVLLFTLQTTLNISQFMRRNNTYQVLLALKISQLLICIFSIAMYLINFYPVLLVQHGANQNENTLREKLLPKTKGSTVQSLIEESESKVQKVKKKCSPLLILKDTYVIWELIIFALSLGGVFWINYLFYPFMLLDIVPRLRTLKNIVKAIQGNARTFIYTLLLLLVIIYIYSVIAFDQFDPDFIGAQGNGFFVYCGNLFECFTSTLNAGIRAGGGIGQSLEQEPLSSTHYWARYLFDLSFFIIVIVLMLNIIFGVVLDAFAELRDSDKEKKEDIEARCLICGLESVELETNGQGWSQHINQEHNIWTYVYFLMMIQDKPTEQCTGLEMYVKEQIKTHETDFFPSGDALALNERRSVVINY